jgi:hypothetical protein
MCNRNQTLDVAVGATGTCVIADDGQGICFPTSGGSTTHDGPFAQIQDGCGLLGNGSISCWGDDDYGQATPPTGKFSMVSAGPFHRCAIAENGQLSCWGAGSTPELTGTHPHYGQAIAPSGHFVHVSAGVFHTCAVRGDGSVECWGVGTVTNDCPNGMGAALSERDHAAWS